MPVYVDVCKIFFRSDYPYFLLTKGETSLLYITYGLIMWLELYFKFFFKSSKKKKCVKLQMDANVILTKFDIF